MVVATTYAANFFVGHEREVDGALELLALLDQLAQRHNVLDAHALVRTMTAYQTVTGMVSPRRQENACGQASGTLPSCPASLDRRCCPLRLRRPPTGRPDAARYEKKMALQRESERGGGPRYLPQGLDGRHYVVVAVEKDGGQRWLLAHQRCYQDGLR